MAAPGTRRIYAEELRPRELGSIHGQAEVIRRLERLALGTRDGRISPPHLLFIGPPGVGKTTAARAYGRAVLGEHWENSFSELRAHDDRSPETLRRRIIPESRAPPSRGAPVRILFFDEVETLAPEALSVLRPALENDGGHTTFILACNEVDRLPAPLRSRCAEMTFAPLSETDMRTVVEQAAAHAGLALPTESIDRIVRGAGGIPRDAIRLLLEEAAGPS